VLHTCGIMEPQSKNGSLVIVLDQPEQNNPLLKALGELSAVQCIVKKGATTKYDQNLTKNGSYFEGEVTDLDPGSDYSVLLYGKNVSSDIIRRGYQNQITVTVGKTTMVNITWDEFAPTLVSPLDGSTWSDNKPIFDWNDVIGATNYELLVDNSNDFSNPVIQQSTLDSSSYSATRSYPDGMYYWKVRSQDSQGNWGRWSSVWGFMLLPIDIEMVSVIGGSFQMGSESGSSNEQPVHPVILSDFQISKYEITNLQYCAFLNATGVNSAGSYNGTAYIAISDSRCQINYSGGQFIPENSKDNYPVIFVTWYGAKAFCEWAGGRLPTEAEWEYAASGGNQSNGYTYSGSNNAAEVGWYNSNSGGATHPVGQKLSNELGLYDMSGNVFEWSSDRYSESYYSQSPSENPPGPTSGTDRVLRGGSFVYNDYLLRCASRTYGRPGGGNNYVTGFRCAR